MATFCGLLDPEYEVTSIILSDNPPDLAPYTRRLESKDCVMHSGTYVLTHQRNCYFRRQDRYLCNLMMGEAGLSETPDFTASHDSQHSVNHQAYCV